MSHGVLEIRKHRSWLKKNGGRVVYRARRGVAAGVAATAKSP